MRAAERLAAAVGGRAELRVVVLLAAVLGLDGADKATVSVDAGSIERAFSVDHTGIGLLVSVTALVSGLLTFPAGGLVDRAVRTRLLSWAAVLWAVMMVVSAVSPSFAWMLVTRVVLGAFTAVAGPAAASLAGDCLPAARRARLYGYVLGGEFVGTGIGYLASTNIAALFSWRVAIAWLAAPSLLLAWALRRTPEPERGRQQPLGDGGRDERRRRGLADSGSEPVEARVLDEDPSGMSLWRAARFVLAVPTIRVAVTASTLGYFFFTGVRTFALVFVTGQYQLSRPKASLLVLLTGVGALGGLYLGGHLADRMLARGRLLGRVLVPVGALFVLPLAFGPAVAVSSAVLAAPLLAVTGVFLAAADPPLQAARLDVMPGALWGRSEGVRTALRAVADSLAPLLFGYVSSNLFGGGTAGLRGTFLLALAAPVGAGAIGLLALRTYPRDVATARESERRRSEKVSENAG